VVGLLQRYLNRVLYISTTPWSGPLAPHTTEQVPHTGVYYTYEWRTGYSYGNVYTYQVSVPHYYTYYTYVSVPHYYQYPVYAYQEVLDHYEPVYAYRTVTREVLDHYDPVYAYRTVQDGFKTTRVPSYTKEWRITVEEWDYWGAAYNGTHAIMVYTEAEAAEYWVGKTYSWGWAGSGEVVLKETFYNLSNGQTVTSQPAAVWGTMTSLTQPAISDSIRNLQVNYKITTTRYSVTDYSLTEWGSRQTTVTATPKNGYQGDVRLVADPLLARAAAVQQAPPARPTEAPEPSAQRQMIRRII